MSLQGAAVREVDLGSPSSSVSLLLATAAQGRVVASTGMNDASSRSHAVIIANVKIPLSSSSTTKTFAKAKLALVDLAGSERASRANATGTVAAEGRAINASLTALGKVVAALAEEGAAASLSSISSSSAAYAPSNNHIPYRDSSLTRVLRDCLDGSSRVAFLICASSAAADARETIGSLRFGSRARGLVAAVQASVVSSSIPAPRTPAEEEKTRKEMQAKKLAKTKKTIGGVTPSGRRGGGGGKNEEGDEEEEAEGSRSELMDRQQAAATSPSPRLFSALSRTQRGAVAAVLSAVQLAAVLVSVQEQEE